MWMKSVISCMVWKMILQGRGLHSEMFGLGGASYLYYWRVCCKSCVDVYWKPGMVIWYFFVVRVRNYLRSHHISWTTCKNIWKGHVENQKQNMDFGNIWFCDLSFTSNITFCYESLLTFMKRVHFIMDIWYDSR